MSEADVTIDLKAKPSSTVLENPPEFQFDSRSPAWHRTFVYNEMFLKSQAAYLNEVLQFQEFLFLNEVLAILGIPRTRQGQLVGWSAGSKIEIDIRQADSSTGALTLRFNVEGRIIDLLPE